MELLLDADLVKLRQMAELSDQIAERSADCFGLRSDANFVNSSLEELDISFSSSVNSRFRYWSLHRSSCTIA
jgi:hypothetical protein